MTITKEKGTKTKVLKLIYKPISSQGVVLRL